MSKSNLQRVEQHAEHNIIGGLHWANLGCRYDQTNNIIEQYNAKLKAAGATGFWLESCNVESTACAIEVVGGTPTVKLPKMFGETFMGLGDFMFSYLNSTKGSKLCPKNNSTQPNNENIHNLAWIVPKISIAHAVIHEKTGKNKEDLIIELLEQKSVVVQSYATDYKGHPGHFVCIIAYDKDTKQFLVHDPNPNNYKHCKHYGVLEEYSYGELFAKKARDYLMEVYV